MSLEIQAKWKSELQDCAPDDQKVLSILLENLTSFFEIKTSCVSVNYTLEECIWLGKQAWLRSKLKRIVNVKPISRPVELVHFAKVKNDNLIIKSKAVTAKTTRCNFSIFEKAPFSYLKEIYADTLAASIDAYIFRNYGNYFNLENIAIIEELNCDFVVANQMTLDTLSKMDKRLDLYLMPPILDPKTFCLKGIVGKYPDSDLTLPFFCPYSLFTEGPLHLNNTREIFLRAGFVRNKLKRQND